MKMMTYFNAMRKAERKIEVLESNLGELGNPCVWAELIRVIRQNGKFTHRLVELIAKADERGSFHIVPRALFMWNKNKQIISHTTEAE